MDVVPQSEPRLTRSWARWPRPEFRKRSARSRPLATLSTIGAAPRSSIARNCSNAWPRIMERRRFELCRGRSFRSRQSRGRKPTATFARRWISASSTRSKCAFSAGRDSPSTCAAKRSYQHYWPRGVALVIAPWNFPDRDPLRHGFGGACHRQHRHHEAGRAIGRLRRAVDGDVRGSGRAAGRAQPASPATAPSSAQHLVNHTDVDMIAFTGSREVGLRIWEAAGKTRPASAN